MEFKQFSLIEEICRYVSTPERLDVSVVEGLLRPYTRLEALGLPDVESGIRGWVGWFEEVKIRPTAENKHRITGRYVCQFLATDMEINDIILWAEEPRYVSIDVVV